MIFHQAFNAHAQFTCSRCGQDAMFSRPDVKDKEGVPIKGWYWLKLAPTLSVFCPACKENEEKIIALLRMAY